MKIPLDEFTSQVLLDVHKKRRDDEKFKLTDKEFLYEEIYASIGEIKEQDLEKFNEILKSASDIGNIDIKLIINDIKVDPYLLGNIYNNIADLIEYRAGVIAYKKYEDIIKEFDLMLNSVYELKDTFEIKKNEILSKYNVQVTNINKSE